MFLEVFFLKGALLRVGVGGRGVKIYYISIVCFSHAVAVIKKILPSFEPTVLK